MPSAKKLKAQRAASEKYYHSHGYKFLCPCCNCKTQLNQWTRHSKSKKHINNLEIFQKDNLDFKLSLFNFKLVNIRKLLSLGTETELTEQINYVLKNNPSEYSIDDLIVDYKNSVKPETPKIYY
jgi:hypothetical protein